MRRNHFVSALSISASMLFAVGTASAADDDDSGLKLAPAIERAAGISYATVKPDDSSTGHATFVTLGGAIHNPLSMPRVGFDVYLPSGLGFGAALGFSSVSPSTTDQNGTTRDAGTLAAYVISPRIGYRIPLSPFFDLVPRLGVTFMGGSLTEPDSSSCSFSGTSTTCTTHKGDKQSVSGIALSPEVVGVIRVTTSFNILGGLAYDHIVSASATATDNHADGTSTSQSNDAKGTYSSLHLWFGMGGYL